MTSRGGFTLVELLFTLLISTIIGGSLVTVMLHQTQLAASQNRNIINQETLRETLEFLTDEIQLMGSGVDEPYLGTAAEAELAFVGDLNNDSVPDQVRYLYDAETQQLSRTLYSTNDNGQTWNEVSTDVLIENLQTCGFTYYGSNNTEPGTVDDVTSITIELALNSPDFATAFTMGRIAPQAMATRVTIRNRMFD